MGKSKINLICYNCGGVGHPKRLCPTPANNVEHEGNNSGAEDDDGGLPERAWPFKDLSNRRTNERTSSVKQVVKFPSERRRGGR